jgi:hypothetical protein
MATAQDKAKKAKAITMMFTAFGQAGEAERMATYVEMLEDIPAEILGKVCKKAVMECKYLPTIAEIVQSAHSIVAEANGTAELPFAEVWKEIMQQLHETYFDWEEGTYSRKEIEQLVKCFGGLRELRMMTTAEEPVIRAQMNKMYDGICAKNKEKKMNQYVLGNTLLIESDKEVRLMLK